MVEDETKLKEEMDQNPISFQDWFDLSHQTEEKKNIF